MPKDSAWNHVSILHEYKGGGGSKRWKCNYCGLERGGGATRIKDHLAGVPNKDIGPCDHVPTNVKASLQPWKLSRMVISGATSTTQGSGDDLVSAVAQPSKRSRATSEADAGSTDYADRSPIPWASSSGIRGLCRRQVFKQAIAEATRELTRLFVQCAIPFHVLHTP